MIEFQSYGIPTPISTAVYISCCIILSFLPPTSTCINNKTSNEPSISQIKHIHLNQGSFFFPLYPLLMGTIGMLTQKYKDHTWMHQHVRALTSRSTLKCLLYLPFPELKEPPSSFMARSYLNVPPKPIYRQKINVKQRR